MSNLSELISRWRNRVDDTISDDYLWSNEEWTGYANRIVNTLCREVGLIEDATTAEICKISVAVGDGILVKDSRITSITRAKLDGQSYTLDIEDTEYMDRYKSNWENADNGTPSILIKEGQGRDKIRLWSPSDSIDTLSLSVFRLPLTQMVWNESNPPTPEIPAEYHDLLDNGVLWQAYSKQDVDTLNERKMKSHFQMWQTDMNEIKNAELKRNFRIRTVRPVPGAIV